MEPINIGLQFTAGKGYASSYSGRRFGAVCTIVHIDGEDYAYPKVYWTMSGTPMRTNRSGVEYFDCIEVSAFWRWFNGNGCELYKTGPPDWEL